MTLFGFSRRDVASQLNAFSKKNLVPVYPDRDPVPPGLSDFMSGRQTAVDPELYFFYSDEDIPPAEKIEDPDSSADFLWEAGSTSAPQRIYKTRIRDDSDWGELGQPVNVSRVRTVEDGANLSYGTSTAHVYNSWETAIRGNEIGICALVGGVLFALQRPAVRRIRFRLQTDFADTGLATAFILDSWGDSNLLCDGAIVTVCDPRKLFAHAIGSTNAKLTQMQSHNTDPGAFLHMGGSVGYAIETYQIEACQYNTPFDCLDECGSGAFCYPRFEVEQCTQSANKMLVNIPDYDNRPKGGEGQELVELSFLPTAAFDSQWPYVDFPPEIITHPPEGSGSPATYTIKAGNPHNFSARYNGWAIIERNLIPSRLENSANRCVPYSSNSSAPAEWHITDVQYPIARWICVEWQASMAVWLYADDFFEGEQPTLYFYNPDDPGKTINDFIATSPCLQVGCLEEGEKGIAFWDPNDQKYYVIATNSALYGTAKKIESLARLLPVTPEEPFPLDYGEECSLEYKTLKEILVFGLKEPTCPPDVTDHVVHPVLESLEVIVGAYRPLDPETSCPEDIAQFYRKEIHVCKYEDAVTVEMDVCCKPCGCCLTDSGPVPGVTEEYCDDLGGVWFEDADCPECYPCDDCSSECPSGLEFTLDNITTQNIQPGGKTVIADLATAEWSSADEGCCVKLTVVFRENGLLPETRVATVCVETISSIFNCSSNFMQSLTLDWDIPDVHNVTLPTELGNSVPGQCLGSYGTSGCGILPINPQNLPAPAISGTWDEVQISVTCCDYPSP